MRWTVRISSRTSTKAYMTLFEQSRELARFSPNANHPGPELRVYRLK